MGDEIMAEKKLKKPVVINKYGGYYDGISPELQAEPDKMTPEEREADLEEERKRCEQMEEW